MNKLLLVLLAICLVSVHAFVRRDAPVTEKDYMKEIGEKIQQAAEDMKKVFEPDTMKKNMNEFIDNVSKMVKGNADKPPQ